MKKRISAVLFCAMSVSLYAQEDLFRLCDSLSMETPVIRSSFPDSYKAENIYWALSEGTEMTPGGRIWNCIGAGEDGNETYFIINWSDDGGRTWTDTKFVIDGHDKSHPFGRRTIVGNMWTDPHGKLWIFFDQGMTYWDGRGGNWCSVCENPDDENPVWSEPRYIGFGCTNQKPVVMSTGEWVLPVSLWDEYSFTVQVPKGYKTHPLKNAYPELHDKWGAYAFVSTDEGRTWEKRGPVKMPAYRWDEQSYVELSDGRWWLTARTGKGIYESFSSDKGLTWSEPEFYLPHCNSRHFMKKLQSGAILMVRHGGLYENTSNRRELRAFLSYDDGRSWKGNLLVDERINVSYPTGFQDKDGNIYISYDYERVRCGELYMAKFTEDDILKCKVSKKGFLKQLIFKAGAAPVMKNPMPLPSAFNPYLAEVPEMEKLKRAVIKTRKQQEKSGGLSGSLPRGAIADESAPGGYYYPLLCGIDVAGAEISVDPSRAWADYCDPHGQIPVKPTEEIMAPVNPCPAGWSLPTVLQLRRICSSGVYTIDINADRNGNDFFYWNMIDGERSDGDIFGTSAKCTEIKILSGEARGKAKNSVWRFQIGRGKIPTLGVTSQERTREFGQGRGRAVLRCVRNTGNHE